MVVEAQGRTLKFIGKDRFDATRKALRFWYTYQEILHESVQEFTKHCRLSPDQKVITYQRQPSR